MRSNPIGLEPFRARPVQYPRNFAECCSSTKNSILCNLSRPLLSPSIYNTARSLGAQTSGTHGCLFFPSRVMEPQNEAPKPR